MGIDLRNGYSDMMCPRPFKWHDRDSLHSTQICPYRDVQGSESVWLLPCQSYWLKSTKAPKGRAIANMRHQVMAYNNYNILGNHFECSLPIPSMTAAFIS